MIAFGDVKLMRVEEVGEAEAGKARVNNQVQGKVWDGKERIGHTEIPQLSYERLVHNHSRAALTACVGLIHSGEVCHTV